MDKIEIIIRHTSAGQTQQFYGVNHYEPEEALRRFHAISAEANEMHWRLLQDEEMEPSPMHDLLDALKNAMEHIPTTFQGCALASIAKAEGRGAAKSADQLKEDLFYSPVHTELHPFQCNCCGGWYATIEDKNDCCSDD